VRGGGADIYNTSDQFRYVYRAFSGDGQIVARVASVQNTNGLAKAGIMFRETLAADSKHVNFSVSPDGWTRLVSRLTTGGASSSQSLSGAPAPYWIKLIRTGNSFSGYRSANGTDWTFIAEQTISDDGERHLCRPGRHGARQHEAQHLELRQRLRLLVDGAGERFADQQHAQDDRNVGDSVD
jgi:hypothetical protein